MVIVMMIEGVLKWKKKKKKMRKMRKMGKLSEMSKKKNEINFKKVSSSTTYYC